MELSKQNLALKRAIKESLQGSLADKLTFKQAIPGSSFEAQLDRAVENLVEEFNITQRKQSIEMRK